MVDEKRGLQGTNIIGKIKRLKRLVKLGANLMDPESVKEVIAAQNWSDSGKETTSYVYDFFAEWMGIRWERPYYKAQRKFPFIPREQEINDLIASCNKTVACFLQIIRETAARPGEVFNLNWIDVDLETKTLIITPVKGSPRIFKISTKLCNMLSNMPKKGERIFANHSSLKALTVSFQKQRRKASYRFGNPRMLRISFRTLRHWRATIEYARTRDILHVMEMLCHRNIKNTLIYTHLVKTESEEEYTCRVAKTVEQAAGLIEAGFDYVCEINGVNSSGKENERLAGILSKGWWGSWDLNPGSPAPQAGILDQARRLPHYPMYLVGLMVYLRFELGLIALRFYIGRLF